MRESRCPKRRDNGRGPGHPVGLNPLSARRPLPPCRRRNTLRQRQRENRVSEIQPEPANGCLSRRVPRPTSREHASTNSRLRVCSPLLPSVDLSPRLLSRKRASFALGTETNDVETELRESPQHVRHTEVEEEKEKRRRRIYIRRWWRAETSTTGTKDVARGGPP